MLRSLYHILVIIHLVSALGIVGMAQEPRPSGQAKPPKTDAEARTKKTLSYKSFGKAVEAGPDFVIRVNIIKAYSKSSRQPWSPPPVVINGAVRDNFAPTIQEVYATTGLVLDEKGHIMVYVGERWMELHYPNIQIEVVTPDGQVTSGKLRGVDERKGIAIVNCTDLKIKPAPVEIARTLAVGTPVKNIELLRPALMRARTGQVERWDAQNDPIITLNPSSFHVRTPALIGGPVLSSEGKVLGIVVNNVRAITPVQRSQAIVLPMADIWTAAQQIIKTGEWISSGWVGVFINDLTSDLRRQINAKVDQGLLVTEIVKNSPAEKAGIQTGDIIQTIDRKPCADSRDFVRRVQDAQPGQTVTLRVARGESVKDIPIVVAKRARENYVLLQPPPVLEINTPQMIAKWQELQRKYFQSLAALRKVQERREGKTEPLTDAAKRALDMEFEARERELLESHVRLVRAQSNFPTMGIFCYELNAQLGDFFGVPGGKGILVSAVPQSTPADIAGIKAGDVILKIENMELSRCADLVREVQKRRIGDKVKVTIVRQKKPMELYVTLNKDVFPAPAK